MLLEAAWLTIREISLFIPAIAENDELRFPKLKELAVTQARASQEFRELNRGLLP